MPEPPDVELYLAALKPRILGQTLERVRLATPFLLRSVEPPLDAAVGQPVIALRRIGKRIVWQFPGELFFVFQLMIAGRFKWKPRGAFGKPCPYCGTPIQRIVHGEHEVNYCPTCQTEGRLLADRSLSKLLKDDWPRTIDELERRREKLRRQG